MEFNTGHRAVVATVAIRLKKNSLRSSPVPRYNIKKLQNPAFQQCFAVEVSNRFSALSKDERDDWSVFKAELNSVAKTTLGLHQPPKKDWLSRRTLETIEQKRTARLQGRMDDYKMLSAQCKDDILKAQGQAEMDRRPGDRSRSGTQQRPSEGRLRKSSSLTQCLPKDFQSYIFLYPMVPWCLINHRSYNAGETTTPYYSIDPRHLCLLNYKTQLPVQFLMTR